jgi:hypothetical protein
MAMTNTMLQELPAVMANDGAAHTTLKHGNQFSKDAQADA